MWRDFLSFQDADNANPAGSVSGIMVATPPLSAEMAIFTGKPTGSRWKWLFQPTVMASHYGWSNWLHAGTGYSTVQMVE